MSKFPSDNDASSPQRTWLEHEQSSPEVASPPDSQEKIVVDDQPDPPPVLISPDQQLPPSEFVPYYDAQVPPEKEDRRVCGIKWKTFVILAGVLIALLVIGAAVGGGVGGYLRSRSQEQSDDSTASSSVPSPSTTSVPTDSSSEDTSRTGVSENSALAAVEWTDESGVEQMCLYFQTSDNAIMQSLWEPQTEQWVVTQVTKADNAKASTALGAYPVIRNPSDRQAVVYYQSESNDVTEVLGNIVDTDSWKVGALTNKNLKVADGGRIAVSRVPSLVYYQDRSDNGIYVANFTGPGSWQTYALPVGPQAVGQAIAPIGHGRMIPGVTVFFSKDLDASTFSADTAPSFLNVSWSRGDAPSTRGWSRDEPFPSVRRRRRAAKRADGQQHPPRLVGLPLKDPESKEPNNANLVYIGTGDESALVMRVNEAGKWGAAASFVSEDYAGTKRYRDAAATHSGRLFALFVDDAGPGIEHWRTEDRGKTWQVVGLVRTEP